MDQNIFILFALIETWGLQSSKASENVDMRITNREQELYLQSPVLILNAATSLYCTETLI